MPKLEQKLHSKGPWTHRLLTYLFTVLLGVLFYWLLGFVVQDIGNLRGPNYDEIERAMLDGTLREQSELLERKIATTSKTIDAEKKRQGLLRNSTDSSQTTMQQLLELQRLSLQKNMNPSDEERLALADSEQLFLQNQREYQSLNTKITGLSEQLLQLQSELQTSSDALATARQPVAERYNELQRQHMLRVASYKLLFLTPLLLIAVYVYLKFRNGTYWALVYAFGGAVLTKVGFVMHEYFPKQYFKYILILAMLGVAIRVLVYLLRLVANPGQDWLLRQYREAYEAFLCPICNHPIRRGPLKFMSWNRKSIRRFVNPPASVVEEPYTCPVCSTNLYRTCTCGAIRHSLLPACDKCGDVTSIEPTVATE